MALSKLSTEDVILQAGRELDLRDRSLSTQDVSALAKLISTSTSLEVLSLYNVRLGSDDAVFLARALEFSDTLATLNFTHNPIGEVGTAALAEVIKFNTTIRDVSLANTVLNPQGCALLADALFMNRTLASLNLEKNRLGAAGAKLLASALVANQSLRQLWLDGNDIGDTGAISIAAVLSPEGGSKLERLSMSTAGITDIGAAALGDALVGNVWLQRLVVNKQELEPQVLQGREGRGVGQDGASASSRGLQTIDLSGQPLSAILDYPILCRLTAQNPRLARLRLSRAGLCGVTAGGRGRRSLTGPRSLAITLKAAPPRLVVLDLSRSFVDDAAVEVIAHGLENNRVLTKLDLAGNSIRGQGVGILSSCLPSSLVDLDVSDNTGIGENGGFAIGRFLLDFVRSANLRRLEISGCQLGDAGLKSLAEGVSAAPGLEWLGIAGNLRSARDEGGSGDGKMALGMALMACENSRLQGLAWDRWAVSKGQKELKLIRPKGTAQCQLPSAADACLLAGVLCSNQWLKRIILDGNPMDEEGLGYLCRALLRNKSVEFLSLRRCGLGEYPGLLVLRFMAEKPGLEVECGEGNPFGEDIHKQMMVGAERARSLLSAKQETRRTIVHLLGEAGVGKSTLKNSLSRGYFSSFFNTSKENAEDRGADDPSERTLGIESSSLALGSGSANVMVHDHGGMRRFRGFSAIDGALRCPTSVYVVVVSLTADKGEQKRQIKYWMRLVKSAGASTGSVVLLVGSRADQLGSIGQDYLQKLWEQAREDLTRELLRAGMDASLPTFAGCLAMDCRKANHPHVGRLRDAIGRADMMFGEEGRGWMVSPLYLETIRRIERWVANGSKVVQWADFVSGIQRQLCPRASEAVCADLVRSLALEGRAIWRALYKERERGQGRGWVTLVPAFLVHQVVGGVLGADAEAADGGKGDGVMTAARVCEKVIGGLDTFPPEDLVQMLLDADICAKLTSEGDTGDRVRGPFSDATHSGSRRDSEDSTNSSTKAAAASGGMEPLQSSSGSLGGRKASWTRLQQTLLIFPALLRPSTSSLLGTLQKGEQGMESGVAGAVEGMFAAGRRVACRSAMFLPGLFHMVQARLANRYSGKVRLQHSRAEIDLGRLDASSDRRAVNTLSHTSGEVGDGGQAGAGAGASSASALVELVEDDLPGHEFVDIVVQACDKKSCFVALLELRLLVEKVLVQVPSIAVEDMAISGASIRQGLPASGRRALPMLQLTQNLAEGQKECSFDDTSLPEPLSDLIWNGSEEMPIDEFGRIKPLVTAGAKQDVFPCPQQGTRKSFSNAGNPTSSSTDITANPFAPGFTPVNKCKGKDGNSGPAPAADIGATAYNPFAAPAQAPAPAPTAAPSANPFAEPPPKRNGGDRRGTMASEGSSAGEHGFGGGGGGGGVGSSSSGSGGSGVLGSASSTVGRRSATVHDDGGDGDNGDDDGGKEQEENKVFHERRQTTRGTNNAAAAVALVSDALSGEPGGITDNDRKLSTATTASGDDLVYSSSSDPHPADSAAAPGAPTSKSSSDLIYASDDEGGAAAQEFSFDGAVFRDANRLFSAHLAGKTYVFGKQRVEVVLRAPGAVRLGVWRPPVDERHEKDREKGKATAATFSVVLEEVDSTRDTNKANKDSPDTSTGSEKSPIPADSKHSATTTTSNDGNDDDSPRDLDGAPSAVVETASVASPLSAERPAVLEKVCDEGVLAAFDCFGSSEAFPLVGCVVAAVSREPFESTEVSPKLLTHEEATELLSQNEYPLFVQFCRPPLLFTPEPEYPPVKLFSHLVCTNRNIEKIDGEYRFGNALSEEQSPRWALTTTAVQSKVGDLGVGMLINIMDYHVVGFYSLTHDEAMSLLSSHPSRDVFIYVHGFNTPFGYGVRSIAVKARACKKNLAVCLAWPSDPPGEGAGWLIKQVMSTYERRYTYCEHNMHATIFRFLQAALDIKAAADHGGRKELCWKGHSMGCYLLLNLVDRLRWKGEDMQGLFGRLILDAPDVPTWFFRSMAKVLVENGVTVCHYFNPNDNAIQASCTRRALERPVPGQDAILAHPRMQGILCDKARSSTGMNHDYGRTDGRCLLDQREFLAGEAPEQRVLEEITSVEGIACWQLKTW